MNYNGITDLTFKSDRLLGKAVSRSRDLINMKKQVDRALLAREKVGSEN